MVVLIHNFFFHLFNEAKGFDSLIMKYLARMWSSYTNWNQIGVDRNAKSREKNLSLLLQDSRNNLLNINYEVIPIFQFVKTTVNTQD